MATTEALVPAGPKHYVWWFPGSPVKVHVDLQLVQRLKDRLRDTGTSISEEGLLFGRVIDGAVEILDFQPASGSNVPKMVAALASEPGKRSLMGYYRTEESDTFHLNAKDTALAEECFRKPHQVFLMIHSNGFGAPNATFFFHDGDRKMADFAFLEFPLDPSLLAVEERDRIQRSHRAAIEHHVESVPAPVPAAVASPRNNAGVLFKAAGWTCAIAIVFALGTLVNNPSFRERLSNLVRTGNPPAIKIPSSSTPSSSLPSMELHVKRQNGDLALTWNRESPLITTATSGVILVQDGRAERRILLDSTQVRGGSLLYSPTTDQILMQLTIPISTGTVTESVMVVLPKLGAPQTYPLPVSTNSSAAVTPPPAPSAIVPLATASKPFKDLSLEKSTSSPAPPTLPDSPALKINPDPAAAVVLDFVPQTPAAPPLPPLPVTSSQPTASSHQPVSTTVKYEPAVALRKTVPSFPAELQNFTVRRTVVEVNVIIDKFGQVSKAEPVTQKNINQYLINSAVNAARLWRFQPARRGDDPVSSEAVLRFVFNH